MICVDGGPRFPTAHNPLKIESPDSGGYVKFKYIIVGGEWGCQKFCLRVQSYSFGN